ncbi:MAG: hypothetical protein ING19_09440 [Azospirillum sp.]|nr:hypothetical protein [Azospirillum sp.]
MPVQIRPPSPLHPAFRRLLCPALSAVSGGAPGHVGPHRAGGVGFGRYALRPADDRALRVELADAARRAGVGTIRLSQGGFAIPDLDGVLGATAPYPDRAAEARALALARAAAILPEGKAAIARAEARRRFTIRRRVGRALRLSAPAVGAALRVLRGQIELACLIHSLPDDAVSRLLKFLADREAVRARVGDRPAETTMREIARAHAHAGGADWPACETALDAVLARAGAPALRRAG